jgi:hypothetical protein
MEKRKVARMLKAGLAYSHIASELKVPVKEVSDFVKAELPELQRGPQGRVPAIVADAAFMSQFNKHGAKKLAEEYGVSLSAVYRAKYRYEESN